MSDVYVIVDDEDHIIDLTKSLRKASELAKGRLIIKEFRIADLRQLYGLNPKVLMFLHNDEEKNDNG